jgi:hypothetical protein
LDQTRDPSPPFDVTVPHPARRYNYWLGGKDNFAADRASGDEIARTFPAARDSAQANRAVLRRIVRHLAGEAGIRQFLDIGTGLPTADNTHEVAQAVAPASRIVYVDNDPLVLNHARALLTSNDQGATAYIQADLRDPEAILRSPVVRDTLDMSQPVALMLVAVLHFIPGAAAAQPIVRRLVDALPSGSFLAVTHATADFMAPETAAAAREMVRDGRSDIWLRGRDEIAGLFEGLQLVEPGIVANTQWRPDPDTRQFDLSVVNCWAALGQKP